MNKNMKKIKIKCNDCEHEFYEEVPKYYEFKYEDFTCPICDSHEDLFEV